ncbi:hypothetical protein MPLA_1940002 [Mesorhizobium sp. ORS 3359]|nr:hypothetical protein MPLA_1940002 [Mesorhizobium sp. ORS 3359]
MKVDESWEQSSQLVSQKSLL